MLDLRIYRAAFVPALLALVVVAFSVQDRPRPVRTTLAPDAFQGERAFTGLTELAEEFADRRPGDAADAQLGRLVADEFEAAGFAVRTRSEDGRTIDGVRELDTVIAERTGTAAERVVVVAHRDAARSPAEAELSGTAALLELARVFGAPRRSQRTLTLVSTSGGSGGAAGARALADELAADADASPVSAVLVLGDLASRNIRRPIVTSFSNALGVAPLQLRRTVEEAVRTETGVDPGGPRPLVQFVRLAAPLTFGEQGVLLEAGLPAVLLSVTGERPPPAGSAVSRERLQDHGRAALRAVTALDRGPVIGGAPTQEILTRRTVVPGWAVRLMSGVLLLPVLLAAVDAFARVRRRRERMGAWMGWALAGALPFVLACASAVALGLTGLLAAAPRAPVSPALLPAQPAALLAVVLVLALGWLAVRPLVLRLLGAHGGDTASPGAGAAVLVVLGIVGVAVWIRNPFAASLLVPALHLWMLAVAPEVRVGRGVRLGLLALGALPVALVGLYYLRAFDLSLLDGAWLGLLLLAGGHVSPLGWLLGSLLAGCAAGALLVALRAPGHDERRSIDRPVTLRGAGGYAGPGSLGGTESALRR